MRRMKRLCSLLCSCLACLALLAPSSLADREIRVTFVGDCTLGSEEHERAKSTSFDSYVLNYGFDYPFSGVYSVIAGDDLTVANLEGVFYNYEANKVQKTYNFRAPTEFAQILPLSSVEVVSLANNHTEDYGAAGIRSTVDALNEVGVPWFATTEYADGVYIYEKDGCRIGFVAVYATYWYNHQAQLKADIEKLKAAGCGVLVGVMHAGTEYSAFHDSGQEKLAYYLISCGCSVIIGHHPHVIQGVWVYNHATIMWSLGNFVFGGNKAMRALYSMLAQFTFSFDDSGRYLGHTLNIWPAQYSGFADFNNYCPVLIEGEGAEICMGMIQRDSNIRLRPYETGVGAVQEFVPAR